MAKERLTDEGMELSSEELDGLVLQLPVSQRKLVTSSADFSVATLVAMLRDNALLVPEFQRGYIWSEKKASRLIESLILQCPIPVIYLNRREDEILEVVDGNQRVSSLRRFMDGRFSLSGLTAYPELDNSTFDNLDQKFQRQIRNRTIRCVIIEPESNPQIKFDVFERLNSGSTPLSPQELRHGLYSGPFVTLIGELAKDHRFVSLTGMKADKRMRRDELVLRFLAFSDRLGQYHKPLSEFLSNYMKDLRRPDPLTANRLEGKFCSMLEKVQILLGPNAFRLRGGTSETRKFNTAYFDAISVGLVTSQLFNSDADLAVLAQDVSNAIEALENNHAFRQNTLRATSDETAIRDRIALVREVFNRFA